MKEIKQEANDDLKFIRETLFPDQCKLLFDTPCVLEGIWTC